METHVSHTCTGAIMDIAKLRLDILDAFKGQYLLNDAAHREDHFEEVFQCAVVINDKLNLGFDKKLMLLAAYFHDMFAWSRNNHHAMGQCWMMSTDHPLISDNLNAEERESVAWAIGQHRATFSGRFKSTFCELINSADLGFPGNVGSMIERAIRYRETHWRNLTPEESRTSSIAHIKSKFGRGGYARYPEMYVKCFGDTLEKQYQEIEAL